MDGRKSYEGYMRWITLEMVSFLRVVVERLVWVRECIDEVVQSVGVWGRSSKR